jgi:hypothetical protein
MNDDAKRRAERARELRDDIAAEETDHTAPSETWRPGESPAEYVHRRMHEVGEPAGDSNDDKPSGGS